MLRSVGIRGLALTRGAWISLGATVYIHPGAKFKIGRGAKVASGCVISVLPDAILVLKDRCIINRGSIIYSANAIEIGIGVRVAHYCSIIDHDYEFHSGDLCFEKPVISAPIVIGDNVWLGAYAIILKGVTIGEGSIIGAQTMVKKSVPRKSLVYCHSNSRLTLKTL
jgi:acetyltransferase-like isoleucine patch superfamily enzyme